MWFLTCGEGVGPCVFVNVGAYDAFGVWVGEGPKDIFSIITHVLGVLEF